MIIMKGIMCSYGESVINDAVTIAWFNTMSKFLLMPVSVQAIMQAIGTFLVMFLGSTVRFPYENQIIMSSELFTIRSLVLQLH